MAVVFISEEQYRQAKDNGISRMNVYKRVQDLGWDIERAINTPVGTKGQRSSLYGDDVRAAAKVNGVSASLLHRRIKKLGMEPMTAATTPLGKQFGA